MKWIAFGVALAAAAAAQGPVAHAAVLTFQTSLDGASENPPNASPGTGNSTVVIDDVANTLDIKIDFANLDGITTVAHIHCCVAPPGTVGVAVTPGTLPGFPVGVTSGSYDSPLIDLTDLSSYTGGFVTNFGGGTAAGAEAALIAGIQAGTAYVNVHTDLFPAGEIRGFLQTVPVPEPSSLLILAAALGGIGLMRRRKPASHS